MTASPLAVAPVRPDVDGTTTLDGPAQRLSADAGIAPLLAEARAPLTGTGDDLFDLADRLAAQLDEEADLRGVRR